MEHNVTPLRQVELCELFVQAMKTTESYLDSFEKSVKKKYSLKLVAFKAGEKD